jgi:hypothetical protein
MTQQQQSFREKLKEKLKKIKEAIGSLSYLQLTGGAWGESNDSELDARDFLDEQEYEAYHQLQDAATGKKAVAKLDARDFLDDEQYEANQNIQKPQGKAWNKNENLELDARDFLDDEEYDAYFSNLKSEK